MHIVLKLGYEEEEKKFKKVETSLLEIENKHYPVALVFASARGTFHPTRNSGTLETDHVIDPEISLESFPENPKTDIFPKCEPFKRRFRKSPKLRRENQMERKFPVRNFRKFDYTSGSCPLFR